MLRPTRVATLALMHQRRLDLITSGREWGYRPGASFFVFLGWGSFFAVTSGDENRFKVRVNNFRQLYQAHHKRLLGYLLRRTGDLPLAADLTQEAFTRYLERYPDREPSAPLLFAIGRNLLYDQVRRKGERIAFEEQRHGEPSDPESALLARDEYRRLLCALQQIEAEERDILALATTSGLSYQEIGAMTGNSLANVKVKVHRARLKLRKILQRDAS